MQTIRHVGETTLAHTQDVDDALWMAKSFQKAKDKHRKKGDKLGNCKRDRQKNA